MEALKELGLYLFSNQYVQREAVLGNCRNWTRCAFVETYRWNHQYKLLLTVEAREKEVERWVNHTFLRVTLDNLSYIYDGSGTAKLNSWWGEERGSWYENSNFDISNYYLLDEVKVRDLL